MVGNRVEINILGCCCDTVTFWSECPVEALCVTECHVNAVLLFVETLEIGCEAIKQNLEKESFEDTSTDGYINRVSGTHRSCTHLS